VIHTIRHRERSVAIQKILDCFGSITKLAMTNVK